MKNLIRRVVLIVVGGVIGILGFYLLFQPISSLKTIVILTGIFNLMVAFILAVSFILELIHLQKAKEKPMFLQLFEIAIYALIGIVFVKSPALSAYYYLVFIGIFITLIGV